MASITEQAVLDALRSVRDPDLHRDIVTLGFVKDLRIEAGRVAFTIELTTPACPVKEQLREEARTAVARIAGVTDVQVTMTASVRRAQLADTRAPVPGVRNIIAVGAGKGGVGKTTVAVNLAIALAKSGSRVGVIDGDVYGPNVPIMLGVEKAQLTADEQQRIIPPERYGIEVVSMGLVAGDESAIIWRGPLLHSVIRQFFQDVRWGDLDYLVIDMPPGTGDVALSLSQTVPVAGAIVVTTPQQVSLSDTKRAIRMYQKLNIRVLGLIENMSYFVCPNCRHESDIFGRGGGEETASEMEIPFLGRIPIYEPIRVGSDTGRPIVATEPDSPAAQAFVHVAEQTAAQVSIASYQPPRIPLTPVE